MPNQSLSCWSIAMSAVLALANLLPAQQSDRFDERWRNDELYRREVWRVETDYIMGWTRGSQTPALVTTSADSSLRSAAGVLSNPTTRVLFGDQGLDSGYRSGGRIGISRSLRASEYRLFVSGMYLGDDNASGSFFAGSQGLPILARPFFDAQTLDQNSELVAYPNVVEGSVTVDSFSEMYLGDIGLSQALLIGTKGELYALAGYRYVGFRDGISVREDLHSIDAGGVIPLNTTFVVQDSFQATNSFHGGNMGLGIRAREGAWGYGAFASVALGAMERKLRVAGQTDVTVPSLPTSTTAGGLLALPTNIGKYETAGFAALPEFRTHIARNLNSAVSLNAGYSFLLLPQTWRAAEQIDTSVNQSQIGGQPLAGAASPSIATTSRDTWVQGLNLGITVNW